MLFRQDVLRGIADGRVTLAFRRWRRAPPADGSLLRTPIGVVCLERVTVITDGDVTPQDVDRAGVSARELRDSIAGPGTLLRIELRLVGDDPRIALREQLPDTEEMERLRTALARMDDASSAPWTRTYLQLIADRAGVSARELARCAGAVDVPLFKRRVRRLKELGLTESLEIGYRLSPRGRALMARFTEDGN